MLIDINIAIGINIYLYISLHRFGREKFKETHVSIWQFQGKGIGEGRVAIILFRLYKYLEVSGKWKLVREKG